MKASEQLTFGLLSTIDHPLLPFFVSSIASQGLKNLVVFVDSKTETEKDNRIWKERTGGSFEKVDGDNTNIYGLASLKILFYFVQSHNDETCLDLIASKGIDCLFNAGTPRKLSKKILQSVHYGVVNVHPGLLPQYRGCSAVEWAIYSDDRIGNTAHFMREGYDTGSITNSEWYEFPTDASYQSIRVRVYRDGCVLAGNVLRAINDTRMTPKDGFIQDEEKAKYWDPIPDNKFKEVLKKIATKKYAYQIL